MPRQRRRRDRRTNVFVQEDAPKGREEIEEDLGTDAPLAETDDAAGSTATPAVSTSRSRRLRSQRAARQARVRSEVFTRSISRELRKLGVLSSGVAVILIVLAFVL